MLVQNKTKSGSKAEKFVETLNEAIEEIDRPMKCIQEHFGSAQNKGSSSIKHKGVNKRVYVPFIHLQNGRKTDLVNETLWVDEQRQLHYFY